jgi:DNA polymerase III epsilon subunit-like protein
VIDTETTGLNTSVDRVVSIAASLARHDSSGNVYVESSYYAIIKPNGFDIPLIATSIHGISTAQADAVGVPLSEATAAVMKLAKKSRYIVAYNAEFDRKMLKRENVQLPRPWKCASLKVRSQTGMFIRLQHAHELAFPNHEMVIDWHNADDDVKATLELWAFLSHNRLPNIPTPVRVRKQTYLCGRHCKDGSPCIKFVLQPGGTCRWHKDNDEYA